MLDRPDAPAMATKFVREVHATGIQTKGLRATIGRTDFLPNTPHVIPYARLPLDVRYLEDPGRKRVVGQLINVGQRITQAEDGTFVVLEEMSPRQSK